MKILKDPLTGDEYTTAIFVVAVMSGLYHAGMGFLGLFAWSGRESLADWLLLLLGFFLPLAIAFLARGHSVVVGWILIVGCAGVPMLLLRFVAGTKGDSDLARGFLLRFAAPSGIIGFLLLLRRFFPDRRTAEDPT